MSPFLICLFIYLYCFDDTSFWRWTFLVDFCWWFRRLDIFPFHNFVPPIFYSYYSFCITKETKYCSLLRQHNDLFWLYVSIFRLYFSISFLGVLKRMRKFVNKMMSVRIVYDFVRFVHLVRTGFLGAGMPILRGFSYFFPLFVRWLVILDQPTTPLASALWRKRHRAGQGNTYKLR